MEYSSNKLSKMSGVSARTLRYYDEVGLLKPARVASSGYRIYGQNEVDALQQILFYRELGFPLEQIKILITAEDFDKEKAYIGHLAELHSKRERLDVLINNVATSLAAMKGEVEMSDQEKFEGFKQSLIDENEKKYGTEVREKYGNAAIDESNAHLMGATKEQYEKAEQLLCEFEETLKAAFDTGNPAGELAQKACDLHKQWLCVFYPKYSKEYHKGLCVFYPKYSKEYHKGLGEMYVADERFAANYEKLAIGCTEFLRDAINIYCN